MPTFKKLPGKKALLIGINYAHLAKSRKELHIIAPHNDVDSMAALLKRYDYQDSDITIMKDDANTTPASELWPSKDNMIKQMQRLVTGLKPDERRFFMFSGHGYADENWNNRVILPVDGFDENGDHISSNLIPSTKLQELMVDPILALHDRKDLIFTFFFDSCYSRDIFVPPMDISSIPSSSQENSQASQGALQGSQQSSQGSANKRLKEKALCDEILEAEDVSEDALMDFEDQIGDASPVGRLKKAQAAELFPPVANDFKIPYDASRAFNAGSSVSNLQEEAGASQDEISMSAGPQAPRYDDRSPSVPREEYQGQYELRKRKKPDAESDSEERKPDVRATKRRVTPSQNTDADLDADIEEGIFLREDGLDEKGCIMVTVVKMKVLPAKKTLKSRTEAGGLGTGIVTCWSSESVTSYSRSRSFLTTAFVRSLEANCEDGVRSTMTYRGLRSSMSTELKSQYSAYLRSMEKAKANAKAKEEKRKEKEKKDEKEQDKSTETSKTNETEQENEQLPPPKHQLTRLNHFGDRQVEL